MLIIRMNKILAATVLLVASTVLDSAEGRLLKEEHESLRHSSVSRKLYPIPMLPGATPLDPVDLKKAGRFAILSKTGVTQTSAVPNPSHIQGHVGTSPIAAAAMTGFAPTTDTSGAFATSDLVAGRMYAADHLGDTHGMLIDAVNDMQAAHVDAAGRPNPNYVEHKAGLIDNETLLPGVYKWGTGVKFYNTLTFKGSDTDVWILQVAGIITAGSGAEVVLEDGAKAENIFWVSTAAVFGTYSHLEGVFLCSTAITFATGSSLNGAALAQSAVTLDTVNIVKKSGCDGVPSDPATCAYGMTVTSSPSSSPTISNFPTKAPNNLVLGEFLNIEKAGRFAALSQSAVTIGAGASILGDVGSAGATAATLVGFGLTPIENPIGTSSHYTSSSVTGNAYALGYGSPDYLIAASEDVTDAIAHAKNLVADASVSGAEDIAGSSFSAGVYKWGGALSLSTTVTFDGSATDVWIMMANGAFAAAAGAKVLLVNGAKAENVFWVVTGAFSIGATSEFQGVILGEAAAAFGAGAKLTGAVLTTGAITMGAGAEIVKHSVCASDCSTGVTTNSPTTSPEPSSAPVALTPTTSPSDNPSGSPTTLNGSTLCQQIQLLAAQCSA